MDRTAVNTANLASVGYELSSLTLEIEFENGSVHQYFDVPETQWQGLMQAGSHGGNLNAYIRYNHRYAKL